MTMRLSIRDILFGFGGNSYRLSRVDAEAQPARVELFLTLLPELSGPAVAKAKACLSDAEKRSAAGFSTSRQRDRFTLRRAFTRLMLSRQVGRPPSELEFAAGPLGKPRLLAGGQTREGRGLRDGLTSSEGLCIVEGRRTATGAAPMQPLAFSAASSEDIVAVALGEADSLGCDVERVSLRRRIGPIIERFFTRSEQILCADTDHSTFTRMWCLKEAAVKAVGTSIGSDALAIDTAEMGIGSSPSSLEARFLDIPKRRLWLWHSELISGTFCAVASDRPFNPPMPQWIPIADWIEQLIS
jgi:phosphopantetheinyl transferase